MKNSDMKFLRKAFREEDEVAISSYVCCVCGRLLSLCNECSSWTVKREDMDWMRAK